MIDLNKSLTSKCTNKNDRYSNRFFFLGEKGIQGATELCYVSGSLVMDLVFPTPLG